MNKTILAAAVAVSLVVPAIASAGGTTLYGNFRYSIINNDTTDAMGVSDSTIQAVNNASRVGIKGSYGDDLKALFHLQMGGNNDGGGAALSSRFYFAGLKGGFGTVKYGRLSTAYKLSAISGGFDPYYDTSAGNGNGAANFGLSSLANGFTNNSFQYHSNTFGGGLQFNVGIYVDDTAADDHGTGIGGTWKSGAVTLGAQYLNIDSAAGDTVANSGGLDSALRLHGSVKSGAFSGNLSLESLDQADGTTDDYFYINGSYALNKSSKVSLAFGNVGGDASGGAAGDGVTIGYFKGLTDKTRGYVLYSSVDQDNGSGRDVFAVGVVHSFSAKH